MILYLTYDGLTDPLGQSQILPYLIGLTQRGHKIMILSFEKSERYKEDKHIIQQIVDSNEKLIWSPLSYTPKPPILSTYRDLEKLKKAIVKVSQEHKVDIIHCRSYPSMYAATAVSDRLSARLIFDMRGFYIDERFDGEIWNGKHWAWKRIRPRLKKLELNMLNKADAIISLTHNAKEEINSWRLFRKKPIHVIPCNADTEHFNSKIDTEKDKPKLVYLGSVGTWYMLEEMLAFFKILLRNHPNFEFHFITLDDPSIILNCAQNMGMETKMLHIYSRKRNQLPETLGKMDLAISFIKPLFSKKASSPTKMGELLSMGIPIICNKGIGDLDQLAQQYPDYIHCINTDEVSFIKTVNKTTTILKTREQNHTEIRDIAKKHFSLSKGVENYHHIYCSLKEE